MPSLVRRSIVPLLVLASGAGLLVFGGIGLVGALGDAEQRAEQDARRIAVGLAESVRREVLATVALPDGDLLDPTWQFALHPDADQLLRDSDVSAVEDAGMALEASLSAIVRRGLEQARITAIEDPAGAVEVLTLMASESELDRPSEVLLWMQAAWIAHRADDVQTCVDCLDAAIDIAPEPPPATLATGLTVLAALYDRPMPDAWVHAFGSVDEELGRGIVRRLEAAGSVDRARRIAERLERARAVRRTARVATDWLLRGGASAVSAEVALSELDPDVLLGWNPETRAGVVLDRLRFEVLARQALARQEARAEFTIGRRATTDAEVEVFPGHSVVAVASDDVSARTGTPAVVAVLVALAACFVAGLIAMFRAVRAESAAARAQAEFLQSVTHEFKTPLASIRLLAERLESGRVDAVRAGDYHGMLADEATRLSVLIDNVLDLGRIERGERAYDRRRHELASIVEDAVEVFRPLAQRDGIELEIDVDRARDAIVVADRGAIVQALLNVLENARKYAREGRRVVVRAAVTSDGVDLDVRDFGSGVAESERERVFERFERGKAHRSGSVSGVGLGLHLARSIVRAHGGSMVCFAPNDGGPGAVFRMRLPALEREHDPQRLSS